MLIIVRILSLLIKCSPYAIRLPVIYFTYNELSSYKLYINFIPVIHFSLNEKLPNIEVLGI